MYIYLLETCTFEICIIHIVVRRTSHTYMYCMRNHIYIYIHACVYGKTIVYISIYMLKTYNYDICPCLLEKQTIPWWKQK